MEKEKESLNKSDAVALKMRDSVLSKELEEQRRNKDDKEKFLASKQEQYVDAKTQIKDEEDRKFDKETEIRNFRKTCRCREKSGRMFSCRKRPGRSRYA